MNLRDRFEWSLDNTSGNAPEVFSKQLAAEAGLGGEYVSIIAHAIREQLYRHKRQWVDEVPCSQTTRDANAWLKNAYCSTSHWVKS